MKSSNSDNLHDLNDEALMLSYKEGTAAAFDVLYARHKGGLYRYVLRQLNHREAFASEIFQDVWMKLIKARSTYQVTAKFNTWLYRLAYNRLVDFWRSEKYSRLQVDPQVDPQVDQHNAINHADSNVLTNVVNTVQLSNEPSIQLQQKQSYQKIKQAIAELPEEQRSAFLLKEDGGLSLAQIAEVTGVSRETVKSRLRYGVKRLQGILHALRPVS